MKWSSVLLTVASFAAAVSAQCPTFRFRVGNSPNGELNGMYLQSYNNTATIGLDFPELIAFFPNPEVTQASQLFASGPGIDDGVGNFMLIPADAANSPVERLVFNDFGAGQVCPPPCGKTSLLIEVHHVGPFHRLVDSPRDR